MGQGDNRPLPYERRWCCGKMNTFFQHGFAKYERDSRADMDGLTSKLSAHLALGACLPTNSITR